MFNIFRTLTSTGTKVQSISAEQFEAMSKKGILQIIDVREKYELASGYVENSLNYPLSSFGSSLSEIILHLQKDVDTVIYCAHGIRSKIASKMLLENGFQKVYSLSGGFAALR